MYPPTGHHQPLERTVCPQCAGSGVIARAPLGPVFGPPAPCVAQLVTDVNPCPNCGGAGKVHH